MYQQRNLGGQVVIFDVEKSAPRMLMTASQPALLQ